MRIVVKWISIWNFGLLFDKKFYISYLHTYQSKLLILKIMGSSQKKSIFFNPLNTTELLYFTFLPTADPEKKCS